MSFYIDFTGLADQTPWSSSEVNETNPGSVDLVNGQAYLPVNPSLNKLSSSAAITGDREIQLTALSPNYVPWCNNGADSWFYLDYIDVDNYLEVSMLRDSGTSTVFMSGKKYVNGVEDESIIFISGIPESYFVNLLANINISGVQNGQDYDVVVTLDAYSGSGTFTGYTPTGQPEFFLQRGSSSNFLKLETFGIQNLNAVDYTQRKGGTFTATHSLGTTLNDVTINGLSCSFVNISTSEVDVTVDAAITTSGVYDLALKDTITPATETQTVQVNVYGVVPSDNPIQKDGAALASLSNVEVRVSAGSTLSGSELYYTTLATTDASGNLSTIDVSDTAATDADPVLLSIRTAAGDSIIAAETVELI